MDDNGELKIVNDDSFRIDADRPDRGTVAPAHTSPRTAHLQSVNRSSKSLMILTGKNPLYGQTSCGREEFANVCASPPGQAASRKPVSSIRPANAELRTREYLTPAEVEKLIKEARQGRYGHRDGTLILVAFRHGLRASEICDLEWSQVRVRPVRLSARPARQERQAVRASSSRRRNQGTARAAPAIS